MANIRIEVEEFLCTPMTIGSTYRLSSSAEQTYRFNWHTLGDLYESQGMNVKIRLFIIGETVNPEIEYTFSLLPFIANNLDINLNDMGLAFDRCDFRVEFEVDDKYCYYSEYIPYTTINII